MRLRSIWRRRPAAVPPATGRRPRLHPPTRLAGRLVPAGRRPCLPRPSGVAAMPSPLTHVTGGRGGTGSGRLVATFRPTDGTARAERPHAPTGQLRRDTTRLPARHTATRDGHRTERVRHNLHWTQRVRHNLSLDAATHPITGRSGSDTTCTCLICNM